MIRADGSGFVRTLTHGPYDTNPAWSPTGEAVAFERTHELKDSTAIYVVGSAGGRPKRLTPSGRGPVWAPDGRSIVYVNGNDVWTLTVRERSRRRILRVNLPSELSWSPTGKRLLLTLQFGGGFLFLTPSGSVVARLRGWDPAWSRDGRWIAYVSAARCSHPGIWTATADGRRPTRLTGAC